MNATFICYVIKNENPLVHDLSQVINFGHSDELISKKGDAKEDELFPVVY